MAKTSKTKSGKKRVTVTSLPTKAKKLTSKSAAKVRGGSLPPVKPKEKWE